MATTATNKQPLLVDRVFHNVIKTDRLSSNDATSVNVAGTNSSAVVLSCVGTDGAVVEDLYVISRSGPTGEGETADPGTEYTALFYFSNATDYLRSDEAVFIGALTSTTVVGQIRSSETLPKILAPVPQVAGPAGGNQFYALYVPKGKVLWVTLQLDQPVTSNADTLPIVGAQGGFY